MAKPKIDLKARLGRKSAAAQSPATGGSIPPPVSMHNPLSGAPAPAGSPFASAPPQGHVASAPVASFDAMGVPAVQAAPAPQMGVGGGGAFEMDADFAAAQRGSGVKKAVAVALAAAAVGLGLGWAMGSGSERDKSAQLALSGSRAIAKDVGAANAEAQKLSDVLTEAMKALKEGKFPEEQVQALGGINIPFDGTNLANRGMGRFKPRLTTMLIAYASGVSKANTQKDKIRSLLSFAKDGVTELLQQKENPTVQWGVYIQDGPGGPWGNMARLPEPFSAKGRWPGDIQVREGKTTAELSRYTGGDPTRRGAKLIPIAPQTQATVCSTDTIVRLRRELSSMGKILSGDDTPGREEQGLVDLGEAIRRELAKIGQGNS